MATTIKDDWESLCRQSHTVELQSAASVYDSVRDIYSAAVSTSCYYMMTPHVSDDATHFS